MAARTPLVLIDGRKQLLPAGDTVAGLVEAVAASVYDGVIVNGSGFRGDNANFPGFIFEAADATGNGAFLCATITAYSQSHSGLIPVNPSATLQLGIRIKSGNSVGSPRWAALGPEYAAANQNYVGFTQFDVDQLRIYREHYTKRSGSTDTTLAVALVNGATAITVADATNWGPGGDATDCLAWWPAQAGGLYGYRLGNGQLLPPYTYTRQATGYTPGGFWTARSGNVLTLAAPWAGGSLPVGTPFRNSLGGDGANSYVFGASATFGQNWVPLTATLAGLTNDPETGFVAGAAYLRFFMAVNYDGNSTNRLMFEWLYGRYLP